MFDSVDPGRYYFWIVGTVVDVDLWGCLGPLLLHRV